MKEISIVSYSKPVHYQFLIDSTIDLQEIERSLSSTRRPGIDMAKDYLGEVLDNVEKNQGAIFVAEYQNKPIGFIACFIVQDDDVIMTKEANLYGYISDAYVSKEFRGEGIFARLEEKASVHLKNLGMKSVCINVVAANERAYKAYLKAGYKPEEIKLRKTL
ncbi:MAG TPA: GNAT family N-acetyltransferase [Candidatus Paceibacterota bacterium]|nr:GNAT family N-acetyltransferase [Candidatus Paceibacterota bacterium]